VSYSVQMAFEEFTKKAAREAGTAYVTIQKRGIISFNDAAYAALGAPKAVKLLFDRERLLVGFRPAEPAGNDTYAIRRDGKTGHVVTGTLFTSYYGIPTEIGRRWAARMIEGGILAIDLTEPPQGANAPIVVSMTTLSGSDG
jgi:hypothetical protein